MSFRIDSKQGLTPQEISEVQNLARVFQESDSFIINCSCDLIVKRQLNLGESLYLRGEPGSFTTGKFSSPSWSQGLKLENKGPDTWSVSIINNVDKSRKAAFKFLIDDKRWEEGENHDLQDLLFLTKKSLSSISGMGARGNVCCEPSNFPFDVFRINPQEKLTKQEIAKAKKLANDFEENPLLSISLKGDLVVKCQLKFGEALYMRGELTQKSQSPFYRSSGLLSLNSSPLNWQKGIKLENKGSDAWSIPFLLCINKSQNIAFKFLINDDCKQWEEGGNHDLQDLLFLAQRRFSVNEGPFARAQEDNVESQRGLEASFESEKTPAKKRGERAEAFKESMKASEREREERIKAWNEGLKASAQKKNERVKAWEEEQKTSAQKRAERIKAWDEELKAFAQKRAEREKTVQEEFRSSYGSNSYYSSCSSNNSSSSYGSSSSYSGYSPKNSYSDYFPNSSSNYDSSSSSNTSNYSLLDEANDIKEELERILGATISDANSLRVAFNKWSLKNHPDKVAEGQRKQATDVFQGVVDLRDQFVELSKW